MQTYFSSEDNITFASNEAKLRKAKGRRRSFGGPSGAQQRSCVRASGHINGGAERDRTADPLLAKQVLSQLSYSPNLLGTARTDTISQSPFINTIFRKAHQPLNPSTGSIIR